MTVYYKMQQILLQNPTEVYYKMRQIYYRIRRLLQNATILLQNATLLQIALFNLIAGGWGQCQFLGKKSTHLPYFHLLTPTFKWSTEIFYIFHLPVFIRTPIFAQPSQFLTPPVNINTSSRFIDLMRNTRNTLFNNPLIYRTIQLPRIQIFKTEFRKLSILSKFWEWRIWQGVERLSCLHRHDPLGTKIIVWVTPKDEEIALALEYQNKFDSTLANK